METPFDLSKLESLMEDAGLDLVVASTRHNVRYLSGGYFYHFHANSSRMALSQYLPFLGIARSRPEDSFYVRRPDEKDQIDAEGTWVPTFVEALRGTTTSAAALAQRIRALGLAKARIGLELPFIPADAYLLLKSELSDAAFVDATAVFDELRAIKSEKEIAIIRSANDRLARSIKESFTESRAGDTTKRIEERVAVKLAEKGLSFLFALVCAGPTFIRAPSAIRWEKGNILHIDAGGLDRDYVADICRMGCLGKPSPLAEELYGACIEVQNSVRAALRPGLQCREVLEIGEKASKRFAFSQYARFVVHGLGMVPYEQPTFNAKNERPLEKGMVLSIETDFIHPGAGHVKIEDSVVITEDGYEGLGDFGREWTIV